MTKLEDPISDGPGRGVDRDQLKKKALAQLRRMKWSFPAGFKFDREEANERLSRRRSSTA